MSNQEQPMSKGKFVFRKHSNIGAADAIQDSKFLETSFVDNGALEVLLNMQSHVCIILGRTGSGKTALLEKISSKEDRVIKINPEDFIIKVCQIINQQKIKLLIMGTMEVNGEYI